MTFNKSLAVFGLLASVATPAAAYDFSSFNLALDEARAKISAWFSPPTFASLPAVATTGKATVATVTAPSKATVSTVSAPTRSNVITTTAAPAAIPTVSAVSAPAAASTPSLVSSVASTAGTILSSGYQSLASLVSPTAQPSVSIGSAAASTTSKSTTKTVKTKASTSWTEAAADLSSDLLAAAFDSAAIAAAAAKSAADALAAQTAAAASTLVETASSATSALIEAASTALSTTVSTVTSPTTTQPDLKSALLVGSQPASLSPIVSEPAPATSAGTGLAALTDPGTNIVATPAPDAEAVIGGNGTTYYVDFASGNDANSGKSPTQAWKRAPGDTASTANAAAAVLKGGDTVRFKGDTAYRGTIVFKQSGDVGNPIIYTGTGFGTGQAIWDGADAAISSVACASQAACGGASNWRSLRLVTYTDPGIANLKLYDATGPLYESQSPALSDPFWDDDLEQFVTIPVAQASAVAAGRLVDASLAAAALGQPNARIAIWVYGNNVVERKITSVSGSTIYFDATGVTPYTDRDGKAAVVGSVKSVTKPGLYAVIATGKAVLYPRTGGGNQVFVGTGRYAFDLRGKSNITVHGFQFVRGTGSRGATREGVGIANYGSAVSNIRIENNSFSGYSMQNGYGMVMLNNVANLVVRNNRLVNLEGASGFRFGGAVSNLTVENNMLQKLGRTGIFLGGVKTGRVSGNVLSQMSGVHGNGMSYYEANSDITVSGNCVHDTVRPLTFYGGGSGGAVNNLRFTGNIFMTTADGRSAVYSWGSYTRQVVLDNNVALGTRAGFILHYTDIGVSATRNRTSGLSINGATSTPSGWTLQSNDNSAAFADVASATLTPTSCSARGALGTIAVSVS